MNKISIGSVSEGTLRPADLVDAFARELRRIAPDHALLKDRGLPADNTEELADIADILIDALNDLAPPYTTFGAHYGDGASFGFWPSLDSLEEDASYGDGVLKVSDLSEVPDDATGYVMHVNDHGNVTLYEIEIPSGTTSVDSQGRPWTAFRVASDHLNEVWSVV